jgi:arylformamidase
MRTIWDISPPIAPGTPVFPGDTPYSQQWTARIGPDCPVNVSAIAMSAHLGAHADAPLHYSADDKPIGVMSLDPFLGPCRVIHAIHAIDAIGRGRGDAAGAEAGPEADQPVLITPDHLRHAAAGDHHARPLPPRVLVRTYDKAPGTWDPHFAAFAPETIAWLASLGVTLVGIDTPSVDPADSKTLDSHQQLLRHDMRVLENLVLDDVAPGDYELIALPLKLTGADASPVRAILRAL